MEDLKHFRGFNSLPVMDLSKILIVEDEANLVSMIRRGLEQEGYSVSVALDGITGTKMLTSHPFDLVILDLMLPGVNGLEICRNFRKTNLHTPVLMLTALGTPENIVTGLDSGADDYLVKPFNFVELSARIRTLMRRARGNGAAHHLIKVADVVIDLTAKTVSREDQPIVLTATEFRLLEFMATNRGKVLSRIEILEHVWDIDFNLGTNVVDVYINFLRKKIDKNFEPKLIHTVIGMGYVLKDD